jgi:hypothetical protein
MLKQFLPLVAAASVVCADEYNHRYKEGDRVDLWVDKVSPELKVDTTRVAFGGEAGFSGERRSGGG